MEKICHLLFLTLLWAMPLTAQPSAESALQDSFHNAETIERRAYFLKELAWFHKSDKPTTAHSYAEQSLELARRLNKPKAIADAIHTDGVVYWYQGNVAEASKAFFEALEIRERIDDSLGLARSYNNIGNVYSWQKDYEQARVYYTRSKNLRKVVGDRKGMIYSLISLAEVESKLGNLPEALQLGQSALELAKSIKGTDAEAFCYDRLGLLMMEKSRLEEAEGYFMDAAQINRSSNNKNQLADNLLELASVKSRQKRHRAAIDSLYLALSLAQSIDAKDLQVKALDRLSANFAAISQYDSAFYYATAYNQAYEALINKKKSQILIDVQEQYNTQQNKTKLLLAEQKATRRKFFIAMLAALFLLIFVGVTAYMYRYQRRTNLLIEEKAAEIARINTEVAEQNADLRESNHALEQFAYVVSHDLREPLRTIGSFTTLLVRRFPKHLDDQSQEYIDFILRGTEHMSLLLDGLLSYARISNAQQLEQEQLDFNKLLQQVLESLNAEIEASNADVQLDAFPSPIVGNRAMLSQLFQNLIANALKFNDKPKPQVSVRYESEPKMHCIVVEDNGIGIEEAFKEKVFLIFHRLEKKKYRGTGLGLAISQKIVARHRGTISLKSELGKGSQFFVRLPRSKIKKNSHGAAVRHAER